MIENPPGFADNRNLDGGDTKSKATSTEQADLWTAHKTDTGIIYYYNALTGKSTYEKPDGLKTEVTAMFIFPFPLPVPFFLLL